MIRIGRSLRTFTKREITEFFDHADCVFKNACMTILCEPCTNSVGRILIVTPRVIGNAPKRNRIRRQLRALFYQEGLYTLRIDCAVIARAGIFDYSFDTLKQICSRALHAYATTKNEIGKSV